MFTFLFLLLSLSQCRVDCEIDNGLNEKKKENTNRTRISGLECPAKLELQNEASFGPLPCETISINAICPWIDGIIASGVKNFVLISLSLNCHFTSLSTILIQVCGDILGRGGQWSEEESKNWRIEIRKIQ